MQRVISSKFIDKSLLKNSLLEEEAVIDPKGEEGMQRQ